jgi:hypothetical protein
VDEANFIVSDNQIIDSGEPRFPAMEGVQGSVSLSLNFLYFRIYIWRNQLSI